MSTLQVQALDQLEDFGRATGVHAPVVAAAAPMCGSMFFWNDMVGVQKFSTPI